MALRPTAFALALCALWSCASTGPGIAPGDAEAELSQARAAIESARTVGADRVAPTELRAATSRLLQAEAALDEGDVQRARRLAREAALDGQLAEATVLADRARTRAALALEVQRLRDEIEGRQDD